MGAKELDRVAFVLQTEVEMQDPMPFPRTGKRMDTQNEKKAKDYRIAKCSNSSEKAMIEAHNALINGA
jgi:hypothetical protein